MNGSKFTAPAIILLIVTILMIFISDTARLNNWKIWIAFLVLTIITILFPGFGIILLALVFLVNLFSFSRLKGFDKINNFFKN